MAASSPKISHLNRGKALAQCHQRNIELHAWFNPYRARTSTKISPVRPHLAVTNPEYVYQWGNQLWMNPGAKVVQDKAYNVMLDVVNRYDVDGIHLDDYFYPYPLEGQSFPDDKTYSDYQAAGGTLSLGIRQVNKIANLIRYADNFVIKPSKQKLKSHTESLRKVIKNHKAAPQEALIAKLNPIIRGWANYNRTVCSKEIFSGCWQEESNSPQAAAGKMRPM